MPWVPRIAPKEEVDAEDASKQKAGTRTSPQSCICHDWITLQDALKGANSAASRCSDGDECTVMPFTRPCINAHAMVTNQGHDSAAERSSLAVLIRRQ